MLQHRCSLSSYKYGLPVSVLNGKNMPAHIHFLKILIIPILLKKSLVYVIFSLDVYLAGTHALCLQY